jgi:hypothetical protein
MAEPSVAVKALRASGRPTAPVHLRFPSEGLFVREKWKKRPIDVWRTSVEYNDGSEPSRYPEPTSYLYLCTEGMWVVSSGKYAGLLRQEDFARHAEMLGRWVLKVT